MLILLVILALGGIASFQALSGSIRDKSVCTGQAIASLSGVGPCSDGAGGTGGLPGFPIAGGDGSSTAPGNGGDIVGPGNGQPGTGEAGNGQPGNGDPGNGQPGNGQPGDPGNGQPGNGQPGNGQPGNGQPGNGQPGNGQPGDGQSGDGQASQPAAPPNGSGVKVSGGGSSKGFANERQSQGNTVRGGAPPKSEEDRARDARTKGVKNDAEVGVEKPFLKEEGALAQTTFAGGSEKLSGGFAKADGSAFAKASIKEGASVGAKIEGKASVVNLTGQHEIPGGIQEKHEVDVLSVKGSLTGKAGISKDVIGATVSGEAGANIAEAKVEAKKVFKIPFTGIGLEIGGSGSASAGANIGGEATAGFFKGEDGKRRAGLSAGFKAALGLGLGGKLSLNVVF